MVLSGKKLKSFLKISLFQKCLTILMFFGATDSYGGSATVNKVWLEHGSMKNGEKGMTTHVDLNVIGLKGKTIKVIAYFYDENKKELSGGISSYTTPNRHVCTSATDKPIYDNSHWADFDIFIPYSAIPLKPGKHDYYIKVRVYDMNSRTFIDNSNKYVCFSGTGSKYDAAPKIVKTWRESKGGGYTDYSKYANGQIVAVTHYKCFVNCWQGRCTICGGYGSSGYGPCLGCGGSGRCSHCKGQGEVIYKHKYREITAYYLDESHNTGIMLTYDELALFVIMNGAVTLYSKTNMQPLSNDEEDILKEAGDYYIFDKFKLSKDYQVLYHNGVKYKRTTNSEYNALAKIKKWNSNSVAPQSFGSGGVNNNMNNSFSNKSTLGSSVEKKTRSCSTCYGTGWLPHGMNDYGYGSTQCFGEFYGSSTHVCETIMCPTCHQSHCKYLSSHIRCKACNGQGVESFY